MNATERIRDVVACPRCQSAALDWQLAQVRCAGCGSTFQIEHGTPILLAAYGSSLIGQTDSRLLDQLPARLRPLALRSRPLLRPLLTHRSAKARDVTPAFVRSFRTDQLILNVGAGESDYGANVLNLDINAGAEVDVVGVAEHLPFANTTFDGVVFQAALEHVEDADRALTEIRRVLRPGGRVLVEVPFMQGYHAAPADYRRFTVTGLQAELSRHGFAVEETGVAVGPASAMAWISAEFLALLVSGRSAGAYRVARVFTTWLAWPLKWLDVWLERHEMAHVIASGVWARARRPDDS
jgi:SAM-dependent methyltransferase